MRRSDNRVPAGSTFGKPLTSARPLIRDRTFRSSQTVRALAGSISVLLFAAVASPAAGPPTTRWVGAWADAPSDSGEWYSNQTLRLNLTPLHAGTVLRVRLSNRFGTRPVRFGAVYV